MLSDYLTSKNRVSILSRKGREGLRHTGAKGTYGGSSPIISKCDKIKKEYSQPLPAIPLEKREFTYSALRSSCLCCAFSIALRRLMRYKRPVSARTAVTSRLTEPSCNRFRLLSFGLHRPFRFPFIFLSL